MTQSFLTYLNTGLAGLQLELTKLQKEQLYRYYERVLERNQVMNLTAITEEEAFVQKHIVDSLALVEMEELRALLNEAQQKPLRLMDVGTGAGLPGLILKIAFPALQVTLFDALQKRLRFLDEVIAELSLKNVSTLHGRAEDVGRMPEHREAYDLVVSRAVANLSTLAEYCLPLTKQGGYFAAYKSAEVEDELAAAKSAIAVLGGRMCCCETYTLPGSEYGRSLLLIKKEKTTPKAYPRRSGIPAKQPL